MAAAPQLRPLTILILFISLLLLPAHCIVAVTECFGNLVFRSWTNNNKTTYLNEDAHNSPREEAWHEFQLAVACGIITGKRTKQKMKFPSIYPTSDCEMRPSPDFFYLLKWRTAAPLRQLLRDFIGPQSVQKATSSKTWLFKDFITVKCLGQQWTMNKCEVKDYWRTKRYIQVKKKSINNPIKSYVNPSYGQSLLTIFASLA